MRLVQSAFLFFVCLALLFDCAPLLAAATRCSSFELTPGCTDDQNRTWNQNKNEWEPAIKKNSENTGPKNAPQVREQGKDGTGAKEGPKRVAKQELPSPKNEVEESSGEESRPVEKDSGATPSQSVLKASPFGAAAAVEIMLYVCAHWLPRWAA
ncbi:hypothetical protein ERJ75_001574500 [Trypanosoma vivax]|nr:hypothetical protein ERJ75_001574500 [Trypanosoma vivax]